MCGLLRRVRVACLSVTLHAHLLPCYMRCVVSDEYPCNAQHLSITSLQVRLTLLSTFNGNFIRRTSRLVRYINYCFRTGSAHLFFSASAPGQSAQLAQLSTQGEGCTDCMQIKTVVYFFIKSSACSITISNTPCYCNLSLLLLMFITSVR